MCFRHAFPLKSLCWVCAPFLHYELWVGCMRSAHSQSVGISCLYVHRSTAETSVGRTAPSQKADEWLSASCCLLLMWIASGRARKHARGTSGACVYDCLYVCVLPLLACVCVCVSIVTNVDRKRQSQDARAWHIRCVCVCSFICFFCFCASLCSLHFNFTSHFLNVHFHSFDSAGTSSTLCCTHGTHACTQNWP